MDSNYKIYFGSSDNPFLSFDHTTIENITFDNAVDLIGDELSSDVMESNVFFDDVNGTLRNVSYGTPVYLFNGDDLIGKYFFEKVERTAVKRYKIYTASMIGLIGREEYYGNFFAQASFEDALNDILFSNGLTTKLYPVYKPQSVGTGYGVKLTTVNGSTDTYKQRLQAAFTINDHSMTTGTTYSTYVLGYSTRYSVYLYASRANTSSPASYYLRLNYGGSKVFDIGNESALIGNGSHVVVDVDPIGGTAKITVDYVKYDDSSVTGTLEKTASITPSSSSNITSLDTAFGGGNQNGAAQSYNFSISWDYYRVYNSDGTPRIDAGFAYDSSSTRYYVFNKSSGYYALVPRSGSTDRLVPDGDQIGVIGDFSRSGRDFELSSSIEFGYGVAGGLVNGWLPISTRREALHQLLFAQNVSIIKSATGKLLFTGITNGTPTVINEDDIFDDNKEEAITEARQISVTEHSYTVPTGDPQVIFDNTDAPAITGDYLAIFNGAPIYEITSTSGITVKKNNCNAATVSGRGTITGRPYVYAKHEQKYQNTEIYDGTDVSVSNITLITAANSDNMMNKLKAFYVAGLKKITIGIIYRAQRCGTRYSFKTLFQDQNTGHLTNVSARASSFIRATCEFISGYVPPTTGGYGHYEIVDHNGEWEVPAETRAQEYPNIRLILIGTGRAGTAGTDGEDGEDAYTQGNDETRWRGGDGGAGGTAGTGGSGGKVYQITIDATNVARITAEASGYDTVVKTYNDNNTLLNTYSSNSGNVADGGITNDFTGEVYARHGKDGVNGAAGGMGAKTDSEDLYEQWVSKSGEDVYVAYRSQPYKGGIGKYSVIDYVSGDVTLYSNYGGGGGAAEGRNGGDPYISEYTEERTYTAGGNGADAITNPNVFTGYGSGGFGGSGGGGGGGAGLWLKRDKVTWECASLYPGNGGSGSAGSQGIVGCLLIYY